MDDLRHDHFGETFRPAHFAIVSEHGEPFR
jgi:hypothetical protein